MPTQRLFTLQISTKGFSERRKKLIKLKLAFNDFRTELAPVGKHLLKVIDINFIAEGGTLGKPWQQLAPLTVADRLRQGFGGTHPILQRTGKLRRGFKANIGRDEVRINNVVPYFKYHQLGTRKIPRRVMMRFTLALKREIAKMIYDNIFGEFLK